MVGFADDVVMVMTARTTKVLEVVVNESFHRASRWLSECGLDLAVHKTEAVLITDRRKFVAPRLMLDSQNVT